MMLKIQLSMLLLFSSAVLGQSYSESMAESIRGILNAKTPYDWPNRCPEVVDGVFSLDDDVTPHRIESVPVDPDLQEYHVYDWKGVPIVLPEHEFNEFIYVRDSIMVIKSDASTLMVTKIDLGPHFDDFETIAQFVPYTEYRKNLVAWIENGIDIHVDDIKCQPDTMVTDLINTIHYLLVNLVVLIPDDASLMSVGFTQPAILIGDTSVHSDGKHRIQYIFQNPGSDSVELITMSHALSDDIDLPVRISHMASIVSVPIDSSGSKYDEIINSMLEGDYEQSISRANSIEMNVRALR